MLGMCVCAWIVHELKYIFFNSIWYLSIYYNTKADKSCVSEDIKGGRRH